MAGKDPGWDARGLLQPLWIKYPGGRDALAKKIGTTGSALSSRNSGKRPLGYDLGRRLAGELGVSLVELGAPEAMADDQQSLTLADRLRSLEDDLARAALGLAAANRELARLRARVRKLEALPWPGADQADNQANQ